MSARPPHVLLVVAGGVAAFKALEVARGLMRAGVKVTPVLTENGARFVTPLSLQALTGQHVYTDLWSLTDENQMGHIQLSRAADLVVVVPATAHLMAQMAGGLCGDLASTLLLATDKPVVIAPAMNVRMWQHPATQANLATLTARDVQVIPPDEGEMACGEWGPGRLPDPAVICQVVLERLAHTVSTRGVPTGGTPTGGVLAGRHVLVTSGPTHEPIDPVRYLANRSSGRQGHAIAAALAALGARVTLVSGPVEIPDPIGVRVEHVETATQMLAACQAALPADVAVCAAAVADWHVKVPSPRKIKKGDGAPPTLELAPNPDILAELARPGPRRPRLVVGFAAETDTVVDHATRKRQRKGCDWIVANDVRPETGIMGGGTNQVHLVTQAGVEDWPSLPKTEVARRLAERIAENLS